MSVKVEKLEHNTAKLIVEVSAEELEKELQNTYIKNKKYFSVPGFRKGKVPRIVVEKNYGAGIFYEEASQNLVEAQYPAAKKECGEKILCDPIITITQIEKGKPFIFEAEVAVQPEVILGEYKGLEVPIVSAEVPEEDIERELKRQQENNSRVVTIEDRGAENGDTLTLDYSGTIDGEPFKGGTATDQPLVIGSGTFIPGFEDQLIGHKTGEELDVEVTFPTDYHSSDVAGKPAVFHCVIKKITSKELPEIDDEFASEVSSFDTLEEYKADIRRELEVSRQIDARQKIENAAVKKAAENATMDLPEILIKDQCRQNLKNLEDNLQQQGISLAQYLQIVQQTEDDLYEDVRPQALAQLQARFVMDAIAEAEGFVVTDEMYEKKIQDYCEMYAMEKDEFIGLCAPEYLDQIRDEIKYDMVEDFMFKNSVQTEAATALAEEEKRKAEEEWERKYEEKRKKRDAAVLGEEAEAEEDAAEDAE